MNDGLYAGGQGSEGNVGELPTFGALTRGLAPASGGGVANFLRADGVFAAPPGGGGGGNFGVATLDFGAFPGSSHASVAVVGQAALLAGSVVMAMLRPVATADHSADEHMLETLKVLAADIIPGTGFTIHAFNTSEIREPVEPDPFNGQMIQASATAVVWRPATSPGGLNRGGGRATRIYGQWTVSWMWG